LSIQIFHNHQKRS